MAGRVLPQEDPFPTHAPTLPSPTYAPHNTSCLTSFPTCNPCAYMPYLPIPLTSTSTTVFPHWPFLTPPSTPRTVPYLLCTLPHPCCTTSHLQKNNILPFTARLPHYHTPSSAFPTAAHPTRFLPEQAWGGGARRRLTCLPQCLASTICLHPPHTYCPHLPIPSSCAVLPDSGDTGRTVVDGQGRYTSGDRFLSDQYRTLSQSLLQQ